MNWGRLRGARSLRHWSKVMAFTLGGGNRANWACSLKPPHLQDTSHHSRWWGSLREIMMILLLFPFSRFHRTSACPTGLHRGFDPGLLSGMLVDCRFCSVLLLKLGAKFCQFTPVGQTSCGLPSFVPSREGVLKSLYSFCYNIIFFKCFVFLAVRHLGS